jgi:hypothetical protein
MPSPRTLNRTLLERQHLTERTRAPVLEVVERLVVLQGQEPNWPYVGLWSRVAGFRPEMLGALLDDRSVVRATLNRTTRHLASGADYLWLRPLLQPVFDRTLKSAYYAGQYRDVGLEEAVAAGREILAGGMMTRREFGRRMRERFPGRDGLVLAAAAELRLALVHGPEVGAWGAWGNRAISVVPAEQWLGRDLEARPVETLILRYLAAFGPATAADAQNWSGLTRLREVMEGLRPRLRVYRDEAGRELFDLPEAELAAEDREVPVRFLAGFDNAILGHADRSRIISDDDRRRVVTSSLVRPSFLVDGFVRGTWSVRDAVLTLRPFRPLTAGERGAVVAEAEAVLGFLDPGGPVGDVAFG